MIIQKLKDMLFIIGSMSSRIPLMIFLTLSSIALELIGLSLIVPYFTAIQSPEKLARLSYWSQAQEYLSFNSHIDLVIFLSILILCVFGIKIALNAFIQNMIIVFSYNLQAELRKRLAKAYIRAPYIFHTNKRSSEIINIIQGHVSQFSKGVVGSTLRLCGEAAIVISIGLYLLITNPIPSLIAATVILIFIFIYTFIIRKRMRHYGTETVIANNDVIRSTTQGIKAIKEARVFGNTKYFEDAIINGSYRASKINAKIALFQLLPRFILEFLIITVIVLTVIANIIIFGDDNQGINNLVVFAVASLRLLPSASQITSNLNQLFYAAPMMEEILADIKETGDGKIKPTEKKISKLENLSLKNLSFSYPKTDVQILKNINFSIKNGEIIGLFGESGSGKTTLVNILLGLLDFQNGKIFFNSDEINIEDWKTVKIASYIPQMPTMIDDQVIANVAIGQELDEIDRDKVYMALKKAHLAPLINALPHGMQTITGEDALFFSGGQKQRLAISRSFYFSRNLIILDEVTSALDKETEKEVLSAIKELRNDAAIIIISHSPQAEKICDRVYNLKDGQLIEKTNS